MNIKMKIIIIIVLIYLSLSYVSCLNCGQFDSHMGATFDLTDLIRSILIILSLLLLFLFLLLHLDQQINLCMR